MSMNQGVSLGMNQLIHALDMPDRFTRCRGWPEAVYRSGVTRRALSEAR